MALLESVPNISDGREAAVIDAVAAALAGEGWVLDIHSDPDHHRSVLTLVADERDMAGCLLNGIARAAELIDLRRHDGIHPRIGAADVVPIVPLAPGEMATAVGVAARARPKGRGRAETPVFLYGRPARETPGLLPSWGHGRAATAHGRG